MPPPSCTLSCFCEQAARDARRLLLQVLLSKIEALESGKEGSGYDVQKKIQECAHSLFPVAFPFAFHASLSCSVRYKDAYEALKRIKRREEAEVRSPCTIRPSRPFHLASYPLIRFTFSCR